MISKAQICKAIGLLLADKIAIAEKAMKDAQESANNETKSSMGDKYETGRAMSQNERDLHAKQLSQLMGMKKTMALIDPKKANTEVALGSLVQTATDIYFVAIGLGKIKVKENNIMVISAISPIAQAMLKLKKGDRLNFASKQITIEEIS